MSKLRHASLMLVITIGLFIGPGLTSAVADTLSDAKDAYGAGQFDEAITLLRPLVRQENKEAAFLLGRMYEQGDGIDKDVEEAKRLYRIAADNGHDGAQQRLDIFDAQGADQSVVVEWYLPAAHEGDTEAQYNLGFMYETGWGVPVNENEAVKWYQEASEMQHDIAQLRLGMMTILGVGTKANLNRGVDLIRSSAENGNRIAEAIIQEIYDVGELKPAQSSRIIAGLRRVLDEGEPKALETLRRSLRDAHKRKVSPAPKTEAVARQKAPVSTPKPKTTFNIVESVTKKEPQHNQHETIATAEQLESVPANKSQVSRQATAPSSSKGSMFQFYSESANRGDADAQFHLGAMYIKGEQVRKDVEEGVYWIKLAAEQGHEMALTYMDLWQDDISSASLNASVAVNWLKAAGRQWDQDAIFNLGFLYESGRGVEVNFKKAMQWYRFAAVEGQAEAKRRLALLNKGEGRRSEGVSSTQAPGENFAISVEMIGGFVLVSLAVFGIFFYVRRERELKMPSVKREEQEVFAQANAAQGMEADDRKFFDELWEINEDINAESKDRRSETARSPDGKRVEQKPQSESVEKSPELTEVERKLAKAVDDLIGIKSEPEVVTVEEKRAESKTEQLKEPPVKIAKVEPDIALKKVVDKKSEPSLEPEQKVTATSKSKPQVIELGKLGADAFLNNGISTDALAAGRISADRLFADGVAIDEAGKAVGRGSYDPKRLNADSMLSSDNISLKEDAIKSAPQKKFGPAAGLLPKKSIEEEIVQGVDEIHKASKTESPEAYHTDVPLTQNEERSLAEVHFNIGVMFSSGDGVPKNDAQAAKWFLKAAEEGLPEAQYNIGQSYLHGTGVSQNSALGMEWIQKAADNNYEPAREILNKRNQAI